MQKCVPWVGKRGWEGGGACGEEGQRDKGRRGKGDVGRGDVRRGGEGRGTRHRRVVRSRSFSRRTDCPAESEDRGVWIREEREPHARPSAESGEGG